MIRSLALLFGLGLLAASPAGADPAWRIVDESPAQRAGGPLVHERKLVARTGEAGSARRKVEILWFDGRTHTFRVVDNGPGPQPRYRDLASAMREHGAVAGINGGFFHPDFSPSGLMVAGGEATGRFGTGGLLSGVLLSSGRGNPYVLRRGEYAESTYRPADLIQTGPFLVDQGRTVAGLSPQNSRRRSFVVHDGERWFGIGISDPFTLAELGEILAAPAFASYRQIHRALNLDGGSSCGFYADPALGLDAPRVEPLKTVRNFVGVVGKGQ